MRIAIFRPGALGDVIATRAVAGFLRAFCPEAEIALWAPGERGALLAQCGVVDKAFDLDSADAAWLFGGGSEPPARLGHALSGCDQAFVYCEDGDQSIRRRLRALGCRQAHFHRGRPAEDVAIHIHDHLLLPLRAVFGAPADGYRPLPLRVPQAEIEAALAKWRLAMPYAIIHPGSGSRRKNWPLPRFAELGARLAQRQIQLAITAGEADGDLGERLQAAISDQIGKEPPLIRAALLEVAAILAKAALYVGNDSGISHLAAAAIASEDSALAGGAGEKQHRRPCVVLFGPTSPQVWAPPEATAIAAAKGQMENLSAAEVFAHCEAFLKPR